MNCHKAVIRFCCTEFKDFQRDSLPVKGHCLSLLSQEDWSNVIVAASAKAIALDQRHGFGV